MAVFLSQINYSTFFRTRGKNQPQPGKILQKAGKILEKNISAYGPQTPFIIFLVSTTLNCGAQTKAAVLRCL